LACASFPASSLPGPDPEQAVNQRAPAHKVVMIIFLFILYKA